MPGRLRRRARGPFRGFGGSRSNARNLQPEIALLDSGRNTVVSGVCDVSVTFGGSSPTALAALNAGISSRTAAMAAIFEQYRFTKLRLTVGNNPSSSGSMFDLVMAYVPGQYKTGPTNFTSVMESGFSVATLYSKSTTPVSLNVPKKTLVNTQQLRWWNTFSTGIEQTQGYIWLGTETTSSTSDIHIRCEYTCMFSVPCYSGDEVTRTHRVPNSLKDDQEALVLLPASSSSYESKDHSLVTFEERLDKPSLEREKSVASAKLSVGPPQIVSSHYFKVPPR